MIHNGCMLRPQPPLSRAAWRNTQGGPRRARVRRYLRDHGQADAEPAPVRDLRPCGTCARAGPAPVRDLRPARCPDLHGAQISQPWPVSAVAASRAGVGPPRFILAPWHSGSANSGPVAHGRGSIVPVALRSSKFWPGGARGQFRPHDQTMLRRQHPSRRRQRTPRVRVLPGRRRDDAEFADAAVDRRARHTQRPGRPDLVAVVVEQRLHDRVPLDGLQRRQHPA
jgi:hypothetical protein